LEIDSTALGSKSISKPRGPFTPKPGNSLLHGSPPALFESDVGMTSRSLLRKNFKDIREE